jgi:hypothetical protein
VPLILCTRQYINGISINVAVMMPTRRASRISRNTYRTGITTDCVLTKAASVNNHEQQSDRQLLAGEDEPVTVSADSAYGTGESGPH